MRFLPLVWKNLLRRKVRTTFTLLAIMVMFLLYGILMTLGAAFDMGVHLAGEDRLMMMSKVSLIQQLPVSYLQQIQTTPGVTLVTHSTWFGGTYQDKANQFAVMAVEPEKFMAAYPEFKVPPDQAKAFAADRRGALAGKDVATRNGWKIGDRIPIQATIWQPKQAGTAWEFNLDAIYDGDKTVDKTAFYFNYAYLDENRRNGPGLVGWYIIKIDDASHAADVSRRLDAQFENSTNETKTGTEKAFVQGFANQFGNIGLMTMSVAGVALLMILLIVSNTMAQSVRERTSELAVLKTLGFSNGLVLTLVMLESLSLAILGGGVGLGLAKLIVSRGDPTGGALPVFMLPNQDLIVGGILVFLLGALAGILPALAAMRLRITEALRRN